MPRPAKLLEATVMEFFETAKLERAELIFGLAEYKLSWRRKSERANGSLLKQVDKAVAKTHNRRPRKDDVIPKDEPLVEELD